MVARHFDDVRVVAHDSHLEVTDARAVIEYLRSMESCGDLSADEGAALERRVQREIDAHGHFYVTTDAGLLTASARGLIGRSA